MAQSVQDIESRRPVMQGEASIWIDTTPERVYRFVSDVSKLGRLSPECHRCDWDAGVTAATVGATFTGYDRAPGRRWSMQCRVTAAEPGSRFAFAVGTDTEEFSRWTYELADEDGGTRVTESYEVATLPPPLRALDQAGLAGRADQLHDGMLATLGRLGGRVRGQFSANGLSTMNAVLPVGRVRQMQAQLPGLSMGEGILEARPGGYQPVGSDPPRRERSSPSPLDRDAWLASLAKRG